MLRKTKEHVKTGSLCGMGKCVVAEKSISEKISQEFL